MTPQLKELAQQVGIMFESKKQSRVHSVSTDTLERFAQLIVRECAVFSTVITDDHYDVDALYRHFGVEE